MNELFAQSQTPQIGVFYRIVLPAIFAIIGAGVLWFGMSELMKASEAAKWKSVVGAIEQSEVKSEVRETVENNRTRRYRVFWAEVKYRYRVEGKDFFSERIRFGETVSDLPESAELDVANYPVGKTVAVFFDEKNPTESVLENTIQSGSFVLIGLGALFFIAGAAGFILFNR